MEPSQAALKGFADGYDYVIDVLELSVRAQSHANPNVARMLNEVFMIIVDVLVRNKHEAIKEYHDAKPNQAPK